MSLNRVQFGNHFWRTSSQYTLGFCSLDLRVDEKGIEFVSGSNPKFSNRGCIHPSSTNKYLMLHIRLSSLDRRLALWSSGNQKFQNIDMETHMW